MSYQYLITEKRDGIFYLFLNRPEKRNAICSAMWEELAEAIDEFEYDTESRVMILSHKGPALCAGSDLIEISKGTNHPPKGHEDDGFGILTGRYVSKPVICALDGLAVGGGAELLLVSDLAVISETSKIGLPEVARGLLAAGGAGLLRIGRAIPVKHAMELVLTGDPIDAQTAMDWGMVNRVVPSDQVIPEAEKLARAITKNSPQAIRVSKYLLYNSMDKAWLSQADGFQVMLAADRWIKTTDEAQEGSTAFAEKREPNW